MIFDTHAHYDDSAFDNVRSELLGKLPSEHVYAVINVGSNLESSFQSIELSKKYNYIFSAVGIHPECTNENLDKNYLEKLENMLNNNKIVAVGEIGLDFHRLNNFSEQERIFEEQIQLALKKNLPVLVHSREASEHTLRILKKYKPKCVVHCFNGDQKFAKELLNLDFKVGVGGIITFKKSENLINTIKQIPIENILLETDAPYLAPVPMRGKLCNSSFIKFTAKKLAEIKGINIENIYNITKNNAIKFFGLN
ncbi:MAG: TatD family hydrolase [Candidatus Improbicoccus devescovinae]|nr:MAG: TatD family hydrolase [Candidatus Improbicoccus devescovinae]